MTSINNVQLLGQNAVVISGHQVGLSEIMLILLALFVVFLIARNIILYQLKPREK
jgi:hypothetical protein